MNSHVKYRLIIGGSTRIQRTYVWRTNKPEFVCANCLEVTRDNDDWVVNTWCDECDIIVCVACEGSNPPVNRCWDCYYETTYV